MALSRLAPAAVAVVGTIALGAGGASAASILPGSASPGLGAAVHALTHPVTSILGAVLGGGGSSASESSQAAPAPTLPSQSAPAPATDPAPATTAEVSGSASAPAARPASAPVTPGTASAGAANLPPLDTCVGCSGATAGGSTRAHATALRIAGITLAGGSAGDGASDRGSLLTVPLDPVLHLDLAGWTANSDASTATGRSALLDLGLIGGHLAAVSVLESGSVAGTGPRGTEGAASSTGLDIRLLDGLDIGLLHSSAGSDGERSAQLLTIDGAGVLGSSGHTDSTAGGGGGLDADVPGVVGLRLLDTVAGGGTVLGVTDLLGSGPVASVVSSTASGSTLPVSLPVPSVPVLTAPSAPAGGVSAATGPIPNTAPVTAEAGSGPRTPLTGVAARFGGLVLVALGSVLAFLAVRPRRGRREA